MPSEEQSLVQMLGISPKSLRVLDIAIPAQVQMGYFMISLSIRKLEKLIPFDELTLKINNPLEYDNLKLILVSLARHGSVDAYRILEHFSNQTDNIDLKQWCLMALQECRMLLESELMNEQLVYFSSPLGSRDNKPRYQVIIFRPLSHTIKKKEFVFIEQEILDICAMSNCILDDIYYKKNYVSLLLFIPLDIIVEQFLISLIETINDTLQHYFSEHIICTNMKQYSARKITNTINKIYAIKDNE